MITGCRVVGSGTICQHPLPVKLVAVDYLALLLILSPIELPVPDRAPESLWVALKSAAETLEIWPVCGTWLPSFRKEVAWCREHERMARGLPSLRGCLDLPDWEHAKRFQEFWSGRGRWIQSQILLRPQDADRWDELLAEARAELRRWELIGLAQDPQGNWISRRRALAELQVMD